MEIEIAKAKNSARKQAIEVRVLNSEQDYFNQRVYYVWYENQVWELSSKDVLATGKTYKFLANLESFSIQENSIKNYDLSLGIRGQIKTTELLLKNNNCDLVCQGFQSLEKLKFYTKSTYFNLYCQQFKIIPETLAGNSICKDIYGLSVGLVLGGTQEFSKSTKDNFKALGLSHLVAVSGFQVVLLVGFVEMLFLKLKISKKSRIILGILSIIFLIGLVGPQPPVLRSGISLSLSLLILSIFGRGLQPLRTLIYSALVLLLLNPFYLISLSFQLSFLASLGLVLSSKVENLGELKLFSDFKDLLLGSTVTFLFTLPIIVNINGTISVISILINLLIVPIIPFITLSNLFGLIPLLGQILVVPAVFLQSLIIFLVNDLAPNIPRARLSSFGLVETFVYYFILIGIIFTTKFFFSRKPVSK